MHSTIGIVGESQKLLNKTYDSFIGHRLQEYGKPNVNILEKLSVGIADSGNSLLVKSLINKHKKIIIINLRGHFRGI